MNNKPLFLNRSGLEWFSSLPVLCLLLLTLVIGTGEMFRCQLLRMGERMFGDPANNIQYFMLRPIRLNRIVTPIWISTRLLPPRQQHPQLSQMIR